MWRKLKAKKCRNRKCKKEFTPNTEWQKYCSPRCRSAASNKRIAVLIRKARLMERYLAEPREPEQQQVAQ